MQTLPAVNATFGCAQLNRAPSLDFKPGGSIQSGIDAADGPSAWQRTWSGSKGEMSPSLRDKPPWRKSNGNRTHGNTFCIPLKCNLPCLLLAMFFGIANLLSADQFGDFTYGITGTSTVGVYAYTGAGGAVVIPGTIAGRQVTSISGEFYPGRGNSWNGVTSLTIPNGVTRISYSAFQSCESLTSVIIPDSVTQIDDSAFEGCTNLASVTLPKNLTHLGINCFNYCASLTSVNLPNTLTYINDHAFAATGLTSVNIPSSVVTIYSSAFEGCSNLSTVTIPNSVAQVWDNAFSNTSLTTVAIPNSVTLIKDGAFSWCAGLKRVVFVGNAPTMGAGVFGDTATGFTVYSILGATGFTTPTWQGYPSIVLTNGPEIVLEQPTGTDRTMGGSLDFGVAGVGAPPVSKSFTVRNTGGRDLAGISVSVTGTHAVDFAVTQPVMATVGALDATTFTVSFVPTAFGARQATLRITSNDADENPFSLALSGSGAVPPVVTTGQTTSVASGSATLTGTANPKGYAASAFFEYGTTAALGLSSPALNAGNGLVPVNLNWSVGGLQPGTTYYYRLAASNAYGASQGEIWTFATPFPPPVVTVGGVQPVGTTGARVSGTVRARGAIAQVFLDYGTDGLSFSSVGGVPATVDGDTETPVSADLTNLQQGVTYYFRLRAVNSGGTGLGTTGTFTPAILSGLTRSFPGAPPGANGAVTVNLAPSGILSGWRFAGERQWRSAGSNASGLTTGDRTIEFRPAPGYVQPPNEVVGVVSGAAPLVLDRDYFETESMGSGTLTVLLKPEDLSTLTVPVAQRAQWRFEGEDDGQWKNSGTSVTSLAAGSYLVECKPVSGRTTPPLSEIRIQSGQSTLANITYYLAPDPIGAAPSVQSFAAVSGDASQPHGFVGQIRTTAGLSSGFVVKPRVVATAGHVVFDDGTMTFVASPQWLFQRDRGTYEPKPLIPRGFYVFDSYEAQRRQENTPGVSSPLSQNQDVAAMYFTEDAGRGGYSGYLASDTTTNEFLDVASPKILIGYPVDGVAANDQGRVFATPPLAFAFTPGFGRTRFTTAIRGAGGMSGGPLCVRHANGDYYPAAIFLGGSAQTVVRAIDSAAIDLFNRAQVSGDGGDNNTGGGITHSSFSSIGSSGDPGALKVTILPVAARNLGAGWRLKPETIFSESGFQKNNLNAGSYILQLRKVDGFALPTQQSVVISGGQLREITYTYGAANTAPTISAIANRTLSEDQSTGPVAFTVGDGETAAGSLTISRASSNTTLVPLANIVLGGSGANRSVTVTPSADQSGTATITLTVSDGESSTSETFTVTVNPVNDAPTIGAIVDQTVTLNTATPALAFTIGDVETPPSSLTLGKFSFDPVLVPPSQIVFGGSGANRTVTITPASGQLGSTIITLTVGDGALTAYRSFGVTVTGTDLETWRFANFGSANDSGNAADANDADGDGNTNREEYAAGTDPNNASDMFRILTTAKNGGSFTVTALGKASRSYVLERRSNLGTGEWSTVDSVGPLAADGPVNLTDPAPPADSGFYRMRVSAP